jgi:hypothetical protein
MNWVTTVRGLVVSRVKPPRPFNKAGRREEEEEEGALEPLDPEVAPGSATGVPREDLRKQLEEASTYVKPTHWGVAVHTAQHPTGSVCTVGVPSMVPRLLLLGVKVQEPLGGGGEGPPPGP